MPSASSLADRIRAPLEAAQAEGDRIRAEADREAQAMLERAQDAGRGRATAELERLSGVRAQVEGDTRRVELGYVDLIEALAAASARLVQAAKQADFSPPPWPAPARGPVEIKFSETREVTLRFGSAGGATGGGAPPPRMGPSPGEETRE